MDDQKKLSGDIAPVTDAAVGKVENDDSDEEIMKKMEEFSKIRIIDIYPGFFTKVRSDVTL